MILFQKAKFANKRILIHKFVTEERRPSDLVAIILTSLTILKSIKKHNLIE